MTNLSNKTVLVTGGTGSFGKKFIEIALKESDPKIIRIFSRGELNQQRIREKFKSEKLRFFIGDVRDKNRLYRAMHSTDIVIHAAALKQIPTCEYNPIEAVKTNIDGAMNVIDAAIDAKVDKVIAISTDKAVHSVNLYGATKLVAEKLFIQANSYTSGRTKISCVRYGNVIGSRGSVIPVFKRQEKTGIITITDKRMTRFWITPKQAVQFIVRCIGLMQGGEIFIPKMPSMKIIDLAKIIAPKAKYREIGIRPSEKIDEVLLTEEEARHSQEFDNYFIVEPEHPFWMTKDFIGGRPLPEKFRYDSRNNKWWLTENDLNRMLKNSKATNSNEANGQ